MMVDHDKFDLIYRFRKNKRINFNLLEKVRKKKQFLLCPNLFKSSVSNIIKFSV